MNTRRHGTLLFTATAAANSALLFAVEPLVSKLVLPILGGTPAVWATCLVFFQGVLLLGYAYAHLSVRRLAPRTQLVTHLALAAASLLALPIALPRALDAPSPTANPSLWLLGVLLVVVGAPFLVLAAGTPLVQHWFSRATDGQRDPYPLYAASNAGSLVALLAYPFAIEPWLPLVAQGRWWAAAYVGVLALGTACGVRALRGNGATETSGAHPTFATASSSSPYEGEAPGIAAIEASDSPANSSGGRLPLGRRLHWMILAAAPSMLLLGVTRFLTTDLAPIPPVSYTHLTLPTKRIV